MYQELVLNNDPKSIISETIRTLRTNLQFASVDKKIKELAKFQCRKVFCSYPDNHITGFGKDSFWKECH